MAYKPEILNVRMHETEAHTSDNIYHQIQEGLFRPTGHKSLPTLLLYNESGLRLYDDITTEAPEYYLFGAEENILKKHADEIVQVMHSRDEGEVIRNEVVLELGAG
jgi:uncharacterized SAM-dependent methyltransferase